MFNEKTGLPVEVKEGEAFVHQTGAALYTQPDSQAEPVARLAEGTPVHVLSRQAEEAAGWLRVQTPSGEQGFLRANTQLTTRQQLFFERAAIQHSGKLGYGKLITGSALLLFGIVATVASVVASERSDGSRAAWIFYGAVVVGGGQLVWGLEQISNCRHTLKKFDALWQAAMTHSQSYPK